MMRTPTHSHTCSFCARDAGEVELLFLSALGACDIAICSCCTEQFHVVVDTHRGDPAKAAALVGAINAHVECERHRLLDEARAREAGR